MEYGGPDEVHHGLWYVDDPGGLFTIEGASRGTYVLLARVDTPTGPLIGLATTDVFNDSVQDVRIALRAPGAIEGRVVVEGRIDEAYDLSTLRVIPVQKLLTLSPLYPTEEATVDHNGRFHVSNAVGAYTLGVHGLPAGWRVRRVTRAGAALADNQVNVSSGERATGIEIVIGDGVR